MAILDFLPEAQDDKNDKYKCEKTIQKYINDLISYAKGKIDSIENIPSVDIHDEYKTIKKSISKSQKNHKHPDNFVACSKGVIDFNENNTSNGRQSNDKNTETEINRLERIKACFQFVNSESRFLAKFSRQPFFCMQHAYNFGRYDILKLKSNQIKLSSRQKKGMSLF